MAWTLAPRSIPVGLSLLAGLALTLSAGCGKVQEVASEKAAEKVIESAITKDGGTAKVEIGGDAGAIKATGVDKDGQSYSVAMGQADVTEKDVGVAFYPGAKPEKGSRIAVGDVQMVQVEMVSADPMPKVTEWYRAQLKPRMNGAQSMEQTSPESAMLMVGNDKENSLVVNISKEGDTGSRISLMQSGKKGG